MNVRLDEIVSAISTSAKDTEYYYDTETGDLEMLIDGELIGNRDIDLSEEERYVKLPDRYELEEAKIMADFARAASNSEYREKLLAALQQDPTFAQFRSTVHDLGVSAHWDTFRNEVFKQAAIDWCDFNGIEYNEGEENTVVPGGIYEHFKGKRYKVIGIAKHSETLEELVVYQQMYGEHGLWVRPLAMFCETVVRDGQEMQRFRLVEEE